MITDLVAAVIDRRLIWREGAPHELDFWSNWIRTKGGQYPDDFAVRFNPATPLQKELRDLLEDAGPAVRILDVGAGPASVLGKVWEGRTVELTAVDALGEEYGSLLRKWGSMPPVPTVTCDSESLSALFAPATFDLAYARNTLDHSYDPVRAIGEMAGVVKPGGHVYLTHSINEAVREKYDGFHQWNFELNDGRFEVWRPGKRIVVDDRLPYVERIRADVKGTTLIVVYRKLAG